MCVCVCFFSLLLPQPPWKFMFSFLKCSQYNTMCAKTSSTNIVYFLFSSRCIWMLAVRFFFSSFFPLYLHGLLFFISSGIEFTRNDRNYDFQLIGLIEMKKKKKKYGTTFHFIVLLIVCSSVTSHLEKRYTKTHIQQRFSETEWIR